MQGPMAAAAFEQGCKCADVAKLMYMCMHMYMHVEWVGVNAANQFSFEAGLKPNV